MHIFASCQYADYARVHQLPSPSPKNAVVRNQLCLSECVRLCDAHMAYTHGPG